jgi:hypothetical protein
MAATVRREEKTYRGSARTTLEGGMLESTTRHSNRFLTDEDVTTT